MAFARSLQGSVTKEGTLSSLDTFEEKNFEILIHSSKYFPEEAIPYKMSEEKA